LNTISSLQNKLAEQLFNFGWGRKKKCYNGLKERVWLETHDDKTDPGQRLFFSRNFNQTVDTHDGKC